MQRAQRKLVSCRELNLPNYIQIDRLVDVRIYKQREHSELSFLASKRFDCIQWCGRCHKGKRPRIAQDPTCEDFKSRGLE